MKTVIYNYGVFAVSAIQILLVNLFLLKFFDSDALAFFNYCYLVLIVASQISVFGIHYSVLHKVSSKGFDNRCVVFSGVLLVVIISLVVSGLTLAFVEYVKPLPIAVDLSHAAFLCGLGILFLSVNKVLMAYVNGRGKMYLYSNMYLMRSLVVLSGCVYNWVCLPDYSVFVYVVLGELLSFLVLLIKVREVIVPSYFTHKFSDVVDMAKEHFKFARYAAVGGVALESNIRVDGFFLSFFSSVEVFAKYSFLSLVFEGFQQLYSILKNFVNVKIVNADRAELIELKKYFFISAFSGVFFFVSIIVLYLPIIGLMELPLYDMYYVAITLFLSIAISGGFLPFDQVYSQSGDPKGYLKMSLIVLIVNVFLNSLLVPVFDAQGAAVSTLISFTVLSFLIWISIRKIGVI